jgi:hypothetical protein
MTVDFDDDISVIVRVHWITRVMFSVGLVFIGFTIFEFLVNPSKGLATRFFYELIIDFGLYRLASSYIKINSEYVLVNVFYGTFKIYWSEVRTIRISGIFIGFMGDDKRVIISLGFGDRKTRELINTMRQQTIRHKIEIAPLKPGERMPLTHLNTRE